MQHKAILAVFILFLSNIQLGHSQTNENAVLWKITGNDLEQPSYLFATINFLPRRDYSLPKAVKDALEDCQVLVTKNVNDAHSRKEYNKAVRIPQNGMINDYLTDDELNQLRLLMLAELEVREHAYHDNYSRLQPIILVTTTTSLYLKKNIVFPEQELNDIAKKRNMEFVGLTTIEEEIAAFQQFPIEDQVQALKYAVNNFDGHIEDYNNLVRYYTQEEDLQKIKAETMKATNESKVFRKVYYDDRNHVWLPSIKYMMAKRPIFMALGAAHLPGESGLIALLREEGYTVTPIPAFN